MNLPNTVYQIDIRLLTVLLILYIAPQKKKSYTFPSDDIEGNNKESSLGVL